MKVAFFDASSGEPVRVFSGQDADGELALADPRYAGCEIRRLEGTPYADALRLSALPALAEFDAACAA